jgi:hypothetical protein
MLDAMVIHWRSEEPPDVVEAIDIEVRTQVARVLHKCWLCSRPIEPGQRYTRIFALVEDGVAVHKHHGEVAGACEGW